MAERNALAIDVGGTFTDIVLFDAASRRFRFEKVLSTPDDPSIGSVKGARSILERFEQDPSTIARTVHATTVATNAVLERKGARVGLIATRGFKDAIEIGREYRYDIYDLHLQLPEPLVPRHRRLEVDERVSAEGDVLVALDVEQARAAVAALINEHRSEAIAICLLNSFDYPQHEALLADLGRELSDEVLFSLSHDVAGEIREYERTSTTVIDAYVKPLVQRYVNRLSQGLASLGMQPQLAMMLSNGGIAPAVEVADRFPVRILESGPAAGAIAAAEVVQRSLPSANAVAFDMGGTTAKLSIIEDGQAQLTNSFEVAHVHRFKAGSGLPLQLSAVELLEIGAGGGSIARLNELGLLNVGPESAGAAPGPACYGLGGELPCVTDADLVLGYLDEHNFLGGEMQLSRQAAAEAIDQHLGRELEMDTARCAWGIHDLVNETMAAATRAHAAQSGIDLRDHALVAFGGAGPVHAFALAQKLGIETIVCPEGAGVASAIGCLVAPAAIDQVKPVKGIITGHDWENLDTAISSLESSAARTLSALESSAVQDSKNTHSVQMRSQRALDMRCQGQGFSITVRIPDNLTLNANAEQALQGLFSKRYNEVYGHLPPAVPIEIVNLRLKTQALQSDPITLADASRPSGTGDLATAYRGARSVWFEDRFYEDTAIYDRNHLPTGHKIRGPAVIEERETSVVVGPRGEFFLDDFGAIVISIDA